MIHEQMHSNAFWISSIYYFQNLIYQEYIYTNCNIFSIFMYDNGFFALAIEFDILGILELLPKLCGYIFARNLGFKII